MVDRDWAIAMLEAIQRHLETNADNEYELTTDTLEGSALENVIIEFKRGRE